MYEKILQKLKEQRGQNSQVSDRTLEKMAKRYAKFIDADEKLKDEDFTEDIENIQGNIGSVAKKVKEDTEKQAATNAKTADEKAKEEAAKKDGKNTDPVVAQLLEQNKEIMEKLNGISNEKVTQSRSEILQEKLKETPLIFKDATLNGFKRMQFETDEDFNSYLSEVEESAKGAIQEAKEKGLNTSVPPVNVQKPDPEEVTPEMQKAIDEVTAPKENKGKF